jgi:hypothetical protein
MPPFSPPFRASPVPLQFFSSWLAVSHFIFGHAEAIRCRRLLRHYAIDIS